MPGHYVHLKIYKSVAKKKLLNNLLAQTKSHLESLTQVQVCLFSSSSSSILLKEKPFEFFDSQKYKEIVAIFVQIAASF